MTTITSTPSGSTTSLVERLTLTLANGETIEVNLSRTEGSRVPTLDVAADPAAETLSGSGKIIREVHVCGPIGVGKSTLVESFRRHGWRVAAETIPMHALQEYIEPGSSGCVNPPVSSIAWGVQVVFLDRAIQRSLSGGVVERPWYENQVFAWANYATGQLTHREYSEYTMWIRLLLSGEDQQIRTPSATAILLWASEEVCQDRIGRRNRIGEEAYKPAYKEYLAHAYFMLVLQSRLRSRPRKIPFLHVVDWSTYGDCTSDSIRRALNAPASRQTTQTVQFTRNDGVEKTAQIMTTVEELRAGIFVPAGAFTEPLVLDLDLYFTYIDTHDSRAIGIRNRTMEWLGKQTVGDAPIMVREKASMVRLMSFFDTPPNVQPQ